MLRRVTAAAARYGRVTVVAVSLSAVGLSGCGLLETGAAPPTPEPAPTSSSVQSQPDAGKSARPTPTAPSPSVPPAVIGEVPVRQWTAMVQAGMVRKGCPVTQRSQLRRVEVEYLDFQGRSKRGHLVVNADTAETTARIFTRLREASFPIRRMGGVERYGGDTLKSLQADNTSGYNCRRLDQINAPVKKSPHANGRAIDVNPRENPWRDLRCKCWSPSAELAPRTPGKGKILKGDAVWRAFRDEGWVWQNIDVPDYMHFDTGYPSKPYQAPRRSPSPSPSRPQPQQPLESSRPQQGET